jgi:hypothetical protein
MSKLPRAWVDRIAAVPGTTTFPMNGIARRSSCPGHIAHVKDDDPTVDAIVAVISEFLIPNGIKVISRSLDQAAQVALIVTPLPGDTRENA